MYEGKNIHFSPLDNKPLCSYSAKVCKQRRLNGYSLCLRHVLEDPGAPFRQCIYLARNKQQCTNPIHKDTDAQFCTSHLQLLGLIPVGAKSCSKANREGKQVKNGLHSGANVAGNSCSPSQKDQLRLKTKSYDNAGNQLETHLTTSDPYTFSDTDPPKTLISSPPLLNMVADVNGLSGNIASICPRDAKPTSPSEPGRSIPISRLYPELVEKLESDRNKFPARSKAGRNARTLVDLQNRNSHNRAKLKVTSRSSSSGDSPLSATSTSDSGESAAGASVLLTTMSQKFMSSTESASCADTLTSSGGGCRFDKTDNQASVSNCNLGLKNAAAMISGGPWMLPVYEQVARPSNPTQPTVSPHNVPVMQTVSKALQSLLNPLPLLKSSVQQPPFTTCNLPLSSITHKSMQSPSESTLKSPNHALLLHRGPSAAVSSLNGCQNPTPMDVSMSNSANAGLLATNRDCALASRLNSDALPCLTVSSVEMFQCAQNKTSSGNSDLEGGSKTMHFVRPRPRARRILDQDARNRIRKKSAFKIYLDHARRVMENSNLLPTGVDSSDDDDDFDLGLPWQRLWNDLSSDEGEGDFDIADDITSNIRRTKLQLLKSKMRRQFTQLQHCHEGNASVRRRHHLLIDRLVASCRQDVESTVEALKCIRNIKSSNSASCRSTDVQHQSKRPCLHQNDTGEACASVALPYANHCVKHIMYNVDQMLFGYCTAKFADKTQCCVPVFDIRHELPLCSDHVDKNATQESQEHKPKKQRKKTKPSALTRPPKKGKKKKCQRKSIQKPQKPVLVLNSLSGSEMGAEVVVDDVQQHQQPLVRVSSLSTSGAQKSALSSSTTVASCVLLTNDAKSKDSMDDDDDDDDALASDLDVTFSPTELPLDNDQATNFLDDHELHEMLNKMADEAFDLSSGKNGGYPSSNYPSSKEVDEEFVRALVEVTKTLTESKESRLGHMSHDHDGLATLLHDGVHEDELTKQIADSLLNRNALSPNGSLSDDQDNLNDLASSLTVHDLKSISQAMESSMIMGQTLELCPAAISLSRPRRSLPPPNDVLSLTMSEHTDGGVGYLNGTGLLPPLYSHEHPLETAGGFLPDRSDSSAARVLSSSAMTNNVTSAGGGSSLHILSSAVACVSAPSRLPPVLPSMLPLATLDVSSAQAVTSINDTSQNVKSTRSSDDFFVQAFQSLPDIQTLMKQSRRLDEAVSTAEFRPNAVTQLAPAALLLPANFPCSQFSFVPNLHSSQFLAESKLDATEAGDHLNSVETASRETPKAVEPGFSLLHPFPTSSVSPIHTVVNHQVQSPP